jgi:hypothetical protein
MNDRRHSRDPFGTMPVALILAHCLLWVCLIFLAGPHP